MRINTNIASLMSYNSLARTSGQLEKSIARLSTGLKVGTAADDAAGLAISEKMRAQSYGLDRAYQNAQDGISLLQTADGALGEIHNVLQRMRELSVHAANDSMTDDDRMYVQVEIDQLTAHINDIATQTQFNRKKLLNGESTILWSTSTSDLGVIVSGSLKQKDQFGTVQNAEGNYKITFNTTKVGSETVQKSNIFSLKHGTSEANVILDSEHSGITNLQATNLVEGSWRVETRERPFGGVRFYNNGALKAATDINVEKLEATGTPHTVAFGEYDIRMSNIVPMMATFDTDVVDGVNISNKNLDRDFDAQLNTNVNGTGSGATTTWYNQTGGRVTDATVGIKNDAGENIFTRYEVAEVDRRDLSAQAINVTESYITGTDAAVNMTLSYRSKANDEVSATYTYMTANSTTVELESTWRTVGAQNITYRIDTWDALNNVWVDGTDTNIAINAGRDIEDIENLMGTALGANATVTHATDSKIITVKNNNAATTRISFSGNLADELGMSGTFITSLEGLDAEKEFNTGKAYKDKSTVTIGAGQTINQVAATLNAAFAAADHGVTAIGPTDGSASLLQFNGGTVGAVGGNSITITNATGSTATELGIVNGTVINAGGNVNATQTVYNNYTKNIAVGGRDLQGVADALRIGVGVPGFSTSITNNSDKINNINIQNGGSMYSIKLSGSTIDELNGSDFTIGRGVAEIKLNGGVYDGYETTANVASKRINDVYTILNKTLDDALTNGAQRLTGGATGLFTSTTGNQRTISLTNDAKTTGDPPVTRDVYYDIALSNGAAGATPTNVLNEIGFSGAKLNAARNSAKIDGNQMDFERNSGSIGTANMTMQQMKDAINNNNGGRTLKADWTNTFLDATQDGNHWGQLSITNTSNNGSADKRRVFTLFGGTQGSQDGLSQSRGLGNINLEVGHTGNSNIWQTSDAFKVNATAQGNYKTGGTIDVTRTIGAANAANYGDRGNNSRDWLWEGGATESARNVAKMNAQFGNAIETDLFTNFRIDDNNDHAMNINKGDKWILFTQAKTDPNATNVTLQVGDEKFGEQKAVTYSFDAGVLSGGQASRINQMLIKAGDLSIDGVLQHRIDFGATSDTANTTVTYGERARAMDAGYGVGDWKMGQEVDAWYSHAYFGENTTYHFASGTPESILGTGDEKIKVNRQNEINASIMFYKENGALKYWMKGVNSDGTNIGGADNPLGGTVTVNADGSAEIENIKFDKFLVNTNAMIEGDKFVVNVAGAAKLDDANLGATAGNYKSYGNIQVTGDPFQQGNERTGSTAQYRIKNGQEDDRELNLLGFYVSPTNGGSKAAGVGYYDGDLKLKLQGGFIDGTGGKTASTIGLTDPEAANPGAYIVHTEVNYQGKTQFAAGALVTSGYFQGMINRDDLVVADFIKGISYSDYKFGFRDDNSYGWLNEATKEKYSDMNASLIFDVIEAKPDVITFRVQGHMIDRDGKEYYAEEETFTLNAGRNTDKDLSDTLDPSLNNTDPHKPVVLFRDSAFGGLYFDEFKLGDVDIWTAGDRFTVALTASGFQDGLDEQSQLDPQDPNYSTVDEVGIFSDNRGTAMPASFRFNEGFLDNNTVDFKIYQVADNLVKEDSHNFYKDQVMDGTLSVSFGGEYEPGTEDGRTARAATFDMFYGQGKDYGVAHYYSNLNDIAQFYDKNGRFILEGGAEKLTVRQNDREVTVGMQSSWEVGQMTQMLSEQIWNDLLKQYQHGTYGDKDPLDPTADKLHMMSEEDKYKIMQFVNTAPGVSTNESVVGTMLAHSVISGDKYDLEFYGSEALMNALNFTTLQQGTNTEFVTYVNDAHTGKTLTSGTKVVAGTTSHDVMMEGVSLTIDGDLGIKHATYDKASGSFKLEVDTGFSHVVHLADNTTTLQIGANEGESMDLTLGDMTSSALGVDNLSVRSRAAAARSITRIDEAIAAVSKQRATIGAQINRLEHTMSNLANTSINLQNARSRIVDVDIAKEMMNSTRLTIVTQAGSSMLVQANQLGSNVLTLLR